MTDQEYFNNKAFCPLPWTSYFVWPTGRVDNCCASNNNFGSLSRDRLENVLSSSSYIKIKKDMLEGIVPAGCSACHPDQVNKDVSFDYTNTLRYAHLETFKNYDKSIYDSEHNFDYRYADLRLRNTCNFACVTCSPDLSSTWAVELDQQNKQHTIDSFNISNLIEHFVNNAKNLKVVYLAGGEPLLIKENLILLQKLYEVNPDCQIRVNTNLSQIKNNKIFDLLIKFKNCHWQVSVDDIGDRYHYIRYPGNWELFNENLSLLQSLVGNHNIAFTTVFSAFNAGTVFELIQYLETRGFTRDQMQLILFNNGLSPDLPADPRNLPDSFIEIVLKNIQSNFTDNYKTFNGYLKFIQSCLTTKTRNNSTKKFLDYCKELDKRRNLDSQKIFFDIYNHCV